MSTAVFYSLSTVCQYLTLYRLFFLCHYVHCCLLVSPLSVSTSHCIVCFICVTMSTATFYSLSTVCQYLTLYRLFVPCHNVNCCLLESVHCLSVPHNLQTVHCLSVPLTLHSVHCLSVSHTLHSVHCLSVPHTPFADCLQTADCTVAVTPSASSH